MARRILFLWWVLHVSGKSERFKTRAAHFPIERTGMKRAPLGKSGSGSNNVEQREYLAATVWRKPRK